MCVRVCLDCVSLAYQRVQKVECPSPRPVLVLGPLTDPVKDMLVKDSPGKFCRCVLGECGHTLRHTSCPTSNATSQSGTADIPTRFTSTSAFCEGFELPEVSESRIILPAHLCA